MSAMVLQVRVSSASLSVTVLQMYSSFSPLLVHNSSFNSELRLCKRVILLVHYSSITVFDSIGGQNALLPKTDDVF